MPVLSNEKVDEVWRETMQRFREIIASGNSWPEETAFDKHELRDSIVAIDAEWEATIKALLNAELVGNFKTGAIVAQKALMFYIYLQVKYQIDKEAT